MTERTWDKHFETLLKTALIKRLGELKGTRNITWQDRVSACAYAQHRANGGGEWKKIKLYDTTLRNAFNQSHGGFMGYLISPTQDWLRLGVQRESIGWKNPDNIFGLNDYLEVCQRELLKMFRNTNFYPAMSMFVADSMVQGTGILGIYEDNGGINFHCIDPQEIYIDEDENFKVDTLFREYELPLGQAYRKFGDKLPKHLVEDYERGVKTTKVRFIEACYPSDTMWSDTGESLKTTDDKFAWLVYCNFEEGHIIESKGTNIFPFVVNRWRRDSLENPYGIGLVMDVLTDVRQLDKYTKLQIEAYEKLVRPAFVVANNMLDFDASPGAVNIGDPANPPLAIKQVHDFEGMRDTINDLRNYIYERMHTTLFATLMRTQETNKYRTATEVQELKGEALSLLATTLGNMQAEVVVPVVNESLRLMGNIGLLPDVFVNNEVEYKVGEDVKKIVANGLQIELEGPLVKRMQSYLQMQGITNGMQFAIGLSQIPQAQEALLNIDFNELFRQGVRSYGMPENCIRELEEVEADQRKMAEAQAQQMQAQNEETQSRALANMGTALGQERVRQMYG